MLFISWFIAVKLQKQAAVLKLQQPIGFEFFTGISQDLNFVAVKFPFKQLFYVFHDVTVADDVNVYLAKDKQS